MIGRDYPELQLRTKIVTQVVPSSGWKAAFVDQFEDNEMVITTDPVVCWGLQTMYDSSLSMNPIDSQVVGYIAVPQLEIAEEQPNFLGYLPEGEDTSMFHQLARAVLDNMEDTDEGDAESPV